MRLGCRRQPASPLELPLSIAAGAVGSLWVVDQKGGRASDPERAVNARCCPGTDSRTPPGSPQPRRASLCANRLVRLAWVPPRTTILRAPMRARDRDAPDGAGARHGVAHGFVGTGDALELAPATIGEAVAAASAAHGDRAARMLRRFADLPEGSFVWTRTRPRAYRLGRIAGPWRYDDSPAAREVGIHHVRAASWLERSFGEHEVPAGVAASFRRGGRNLQRIHDGDAERRTGELWDANRLG